MIKTAAQILAEIGSEEPDRISRPSGASPRGQLAPCGTDKRYGQHHRRGEPIDDACREAHNAATRVSRAKSKERKR